MGILPENSGQRLSGKNFRPGPGIILPEESVRNVPDHGDSAGKFRSTIIRKNISYSGSGIIMTSYHAAGEGVTRV
jgi:hypothetical protein